MLLRTEPLVEEEILVEVSEGTPTAVVVSTSVKEVFAAVKYSTRQATEKRTNSNIGDYR